MDSWEDWDEVDDDSAKKLVTEHASEKKSGTWDGVTHEKEPEVEKEEEEKEWETPSDSLRQAHPFYAAQPAVRKVLTRRDNPTKGGAAANLSKDGNDEKGTKSLQEREREYEQIRAKIFEGK